MIVGEHNLDTDLNVNPVQGEEAVQHALGPQGRSPDAHADPAHDPRTGHPVSSSDDEMVEVTPEVHPPAQDHPAGPGPSLSPGGRKHRPDGHFGTPTFGSTGMDL
ncbi:MAG: hypothetical protein MZU91_14315 [Desulfosudis oleivorans]|nr:hypothetical protein [Desulfosudis oleivorans]